MNANRKPFFIRPVRRGDVAELCALLDEIIGIGGTTAIESPMSQEEFRDHFVDGAAHVACFVAEAETGKLLGYQSVERHDKLPPGWADIATFARANPKTPGVGTALFQVTKVHAPKISVVALNATIRADNTGGLAYYAKMGFVTYTVHKAVPLMDGALVDRISKRYDLAAQIASTR